MWLRMEPLKLGVVFVARGAPWARKTKNVKKPLGEKGQTFRKSKNLFGPKLTFSIV